MIRLEDEKFKKAIVQLDAMNWASRVEFFSQWWSEIFLLWWFFYFRENFIVKLADFHYIWIEALFEDKNVMLEWFRWSIKTTLVIAVTTYKITHKMTKFVVWQSFEDTASTENTTNIARNLLNPRIVADYWKLFKLSWGNKEDLEKKSVSNFDTSNWVKVRAASLWQKLRWALSKTDRPDLLIVDDIDVSDSVRNITTIDKNYRKLTWETFWAMTKTWDARIYFLWNTINQDWIVPRFRKEKKATKNWLVYHQPLIVEWKIIWDFFTEKTLDKIKEDEWTWAFNQNYLLIPYAWWDTIIKREHIQYKDIIPDCKDITIWVDPAISEKTQSDPFAITITWCIWDNYYVYEAIELIWKQKDPFNAVKIIKNLYIKYRANRVVVETVAFQKVMSILLKNEWLATEEVNPSRDKVTRLMEKQYIFEQWKIWFKTEWTESLINQLLEFPNVIHDDLVDSLVYSIRKKKKWMVFTSL